MRVRLKHERLAKALAESPVTLNRWAQRMGLRSGHLSQLANGKRLYPTARTRKKLLDALDLDFDELFEVETPAPPDLSPAPPRRRDFSDAGAPQPRPRQQPPRRIPGMYGWWLDLRYAVRGMVRRPGLTATLVATLALGLGVNLAIFTLVNAVLLKALPYDEPERLYAAFTLSAEREGRSNFSFPDTLDFQERLDGTLDLAVADWEPFSLAGGDRPQRVGGGQVTGNFARVAGVEMLRGRFFNEDERRDGAAVTVLGEGLWRSSFGADPAIVGRQVLLDGRTVTVLGVAPRHLDLLQRCDLFVPLQASADPQYRESFWLAGFARLAPGVGEDQARDRLRTVAAELATEHPQSHAGRSADLVPLHPSRTAEARPVLAVLAGIGLAILLTVCANVANLLLFRGAARGQELGLRAALGANRLRLVRQLMTESGLLTLLGLGLGGLLALVGQRLLWALVPTSEVPSWIELAPDYRVVLFAVLVATLSAMLLGAVPALVQTRALAHSTRARSGSTTAGRRPRHLLVVTQVAISCVLLMGAGLMLRSLERLTANPSGFDTEGALVVGLDLLALRSEERSVREQRFLEHVATIRAVPGVDAVGVIDRLPLGGASNIVGVTVEAPTVESYDPFILQSTVTPGYFAAAGIPKLAGELFPTDATGTVPQETGAPQIVVSQKLAEVFWPGDRAVGKRLKLGRPTDDAPWLMVRGVVGDVRHLGLDREPRPMLYTTRGAVGMTRAQWIVRSSLPAATLTREVRTAVRSVDPNQPLWGVRTLAEHVERAVWQERFYASIFWLLAGLAIALTAIGLYGLLAFAVQQRRHELGIRLALGATTTQVGRTVGADGLRLVGLGLVLGIPGALALGRVLAGLLYGVEGSDPVVLALTLGLLLTVGLAAIALPARRAAAVDPATALRTDG